MTRVTFYKVTLTTKSLDLNTVIFKANIKATNTNCFDHEEVFDEEYAKKFDNDYKVTVLEYDYTNGHTVLVEWSVLEDDDDEEEDDYFSGRDLIIDEEDPYDPITYEGWRQQDTIDLYRYER